MPYQYLREPLTAEEADRLANAGENSTEQLIVWALLDIGLRVSELCDLITNLPAGLRREECRAFRASGVIGPFGLCRRPGNGLA
jgi:integrase/recombinase XerD